MFGTLEVFTLHGIDEKHASFAIMKQDVGGLEVFKVQANHLGFLLKMQIILRRPEIGLGFCISNKHLVMAMLLVSRPHFLSSKGVNHRQILRLINF